VEDVLVVRFVTIWAATEYPGEKTSFESSSLDIASARKTGSSHFGGTLKCPIELIGLTTSEKLVSFLVAEGVSTLIVRLVFDKSFASLGVVVYVMMSIAATPDLSGSIRYDGKVWRLSKSEKAPEWNIN
jgi:hypothetical protein